jgi:ATP/maltotriose-dependent transcriptional regulator MalT
MEHVYGVEGPDQYRRGPGGLKPLPSLSEGYEQLERGEVEAAKSSFARAVAQERTPEGLEALGMAAWLLHDRETVFAAREGAYELYRQSGDRLSAGRVAVWLTQDSATLRGELAVANGWLARARTLLQDLPQSPEHAWLAIMEATKALVADNDADAALDLASDAVGVSRVAGQPSLEALALAIQGVALVTLGRISGGMRKLDEAATACLGGEVKEHHIISSVLCHMMDACDRVRDWERARQWFEHVAALATRWNAPEFYAQCRPHYAVILTWRGAWQEAERELKASIDDLETIAPPMAIEGIVRLAELRWRQGRWEEAASLFEQVNREPLAQLGQGELALGQGDAATALELAARCLRRLPPNDRLERIPALDLYIRSCLAIGEVDRAREVLPELNQIAELVSTRPVSAAVHACRGLIAAAARNQVEALNQLEDAVDLFEASEAPFETSRTRMALASVLATSGRTEDAQRAAARALECFVSLGATREAEQARQFIAQAGAPDAARPTPSGLSRREVEVLRLLAIGLSNQEIAERLVLSVRTVQRHVDNIYSKIGVRGRGAAGAFAASHGLLQQ